MFSKWFISHSISELNKAVYKVYFSDEKSSLLGQFIEGKLVL